MQFLQVWNFFSDCPCICANRLVGIFFGGLDNRRNTGFQNGRHGTNTETGVADTLFFTLFALTTMPRLVP